MLSQPQLSFIFINDIDIVESRTVKNEERI